MWLAWQKFGNTFGQQKKEPMWYLGTQLNPLGFRHLSVAKGLASHTAWARQTSEKVRSGVAHDGDAFHLGRWLSCKTSPSASPALKADPTVFLCAS